MDTVNPAWYQHNFVVSLYEHDIFHMDAHWPMCLALTGWMSKSIAQVAPFGWKHFAVNPLSPKPAIQIKSCSIPGTALAPNAWYDQQRVMNTGLSFKDDHTSLLHCMYFKGRDWVKFIITQREDGHHKKHPSGSHS